MLDILYPSVRRSMRWSVHIFTLFHPQSQPPHPTGFHRCLRPDWQHEKEYPSTQSLDSIPPGMVYRPLDKNVSLLQHFQFFCRTAPTSPSSTTLESRVSVLCMSAKGPGKNVDDAHDQYRCCAPHRACSRDGTYTPKGRCFWLTS
jgi:hypothetical protein